MMWGVYLWPAAAGGHGAFVTSPRRGQRPPRLRPAVGREALDVS